MPSLSEIEKSCLRNLSFPEQHWRRHALDPAKETCQWIEKHHIFIEWNEQLGHLLCIRGKPGSGKSMAMKYLFLSMTRKPSNQMVVSFFFHGQGVDLQKNRLGLYRSLLHQLYRRLPEAFPSLTKSFKDYEVQTSEWYWTVSELKQHLITGLRGVCEQYPLVILIDALDEAGDKEARHIISDLKTVKDESEVRSAQLKICFACRHYPEVDLEGGRTIIMEDVNGPDIFIVIGKILENSKHINDKEKAQVRWNILNNSRGVFQWATLVMQSALERNLEGDSRATTRGLNDLPEDLHSLSKSLLQRPDGHNQQHRTRQRMRLFQWLLFSERPLSLEELQQALAFDHESGHISISQYESGDDFIHQRDMNASITNLLRGLAQIRGGYSGTMVEFIHQSVIDFLKDTGIGLLMSSSRSSSIQLGHFHISRSCLTYLRTQEVSEALDGFVKVAIANNSPTMHSRSQQLKSHFPLIDYAWKYWIAHACHRHEAVIEKACNLDDRDLLDFFKWPNDMEFIASWVHLRKALGYPLEKSGREKRLHISPFLEFGPPRGDFPTRWPNPDSRLIHLLAVCGLQNAIAAIFNREQDSTTSLNNPLEVPDSRGLGPLVYSISGHQFQVTKYLLEKGASLRFAKPPSEGTFLHHIISTQPTAEIVALLCAHGADINSQVMSNRDSPLRTAIQYKGVAGVEALLMAGANADARNSHGRTPLHEAATSILGANSIPIVKLLRDYGATPEAVDNNENTALHVRVQRSSKHAETFLDFGTIDVRNTGGKTPLMLAASKGMHDVVEILLQFGADATNARDPFGSTALMHTASLFKMALAFGKELHTVRLLLQFGGDRGLNDSRKAELNSAMEVEDRARVYKVLSLVRQYAYMEIYRESRRRQLRD